MKPDLVYTSERGYGFEPGAKVEALERRGEGLVTSDQPFLFSVALPEGNYNVTITLGDPDGTSSTTVKAESRRLMLERVETKQGELATRTFTVNVRNARIDHGSNGEVKLNGREREPSARHWDDKLTLEFNGARPCLDALEITAAPDAITVYIAGDSTVTDQTREPWAAWGQMLPRFFKPGVAIANHAESGRALRSFQNEKRLDKILSTIKPGDYLFIQFAHNDQKEKGPNVGAFTTYKASLEHYIDEARKRGARPVVVTAMHRRTFDERGKIRNSLGDYPDAVRQTAREQRVPLIDLNSMSQAFYEALGPETSKRAFVHYAAGSLPGLRQALADNTHFNAYGAYELARCIVEGIKTNHLDLATFLIEGIPPFDPAHPDPIDSFNLPASPSATNDAPEGR